LDDPYFFETNFFFVFPRRAKVDSSSFSSLLRREEAVRFRRLSCLTILVFFFSSSFSPSFGPVQSGLLSFRDALGVVSSLFVQRKSVFLLRENVRFALHLAFSVPRQGLSLFFFFFSFSSGER